MKELKDTSFVASKGYQQQAKEGMLATLLNLTSEICDDDKMNKVDKIHPLCEGFKMILWLMDEVKTEEKK